MVQDLSLLVHNEIINARFSNGEMMSRVLNQYVSMA